MSYTSVSNGGASEPGFVYLVVCTVFQSNSHHYRQTQADLAILKLIDLSEEISLVPLYSSQGDIRSQSAPAPKSSTTH